MSKSVKKKKKVPFLYRVIAVVLGIATLLLVGSIIYLNILNFPLLILVLIVILGISCLSILIMLKSRIKKIGFGFSVVLVLMFSVLAFFINKTTGLLSNLNLSYKTYNYSVVVVESDSYEKLNDINGLSLGYYDDGSVENDKALNKVLKKVDVDSAGYEDTHSLAMALLNGEVGAILVEDSYLDILDESVEYDDKGFKSWIEKIYSFVIIANTSYIAKDINVVKEPFNIYVSGIDTYGEISSVSRSDVNMVISVNPSTQQILLTSIPRDYYVQLHGKSGYKDKLTHAGLYGVDMSIQTIEDLLDIEINYYVKVNFSSVIDIIDAIGGITVYSDYTFTSIDNYNYTEGYNEVNGEEALSFARERKAFVTGDRQRVKNQQAVFRAIFDKCTSKEIITKYSKLLDSLSGSFVTNMPMSRMTSLVRVQLAKNYSWNIVSNSLEGSDGSNYTYSAPSYKAYVMIPDEESVMYAGELINKVEAGEELDEELMNEVNQAANGNTSIGNSKVTNSNEDTKVVVKEDGGLKVKLVRSSVTLVEGDEYIYHGYSATYNGEDITNDSGLEEEFSINGKVFDNYRDLVRYVTYNLESGNYTITYDISYKGESKTLQQSVIIEGAEKSNKVVSDGEASREEVD